MRLALLGAFIVVIWAAVISIGGAAQTTNPPQLVAIVVLTLSVVIQRINGVQRWLAAPKGKRERLVEGMAQHALTEITRGRVITDTLLELRVHVWAVPFWYRKLFPYSFRVRLKRVIPKERFPRLSKLTLRPYMTRVAAIGLQKQAPSGVRFRKGEGIIGFCIANNDDTETLVIDTSDRKFQEALEAPNEEAWQKISPEIAGNLKLADARKLAHRYGHVIARVVQDNDTGEAIGCVTISLRTVSDPTLQILTSKDILRQLAVCAMSVATPLA